MTLVLTHTPPVPLAGGRVRIRPASGQTGNAVELRIRTLPASSRLAPGAVDPRDPYSEHFVPDVPGSYVFDAIDWTENRRPARFEGDPDARPHKTNNGTATHTVHVAETMRVRLGVPPDTLTLGLLVAGDVVRGVLIEAAGTGAAELASQDPAILLLANALVGVTVSTGLDRTLVAKANNLAAKYEAHRQRTTGSTHAAADSTYGLSLTTATASNDGAIAILNQIRAQLAQHMVLVYQEGDPPTVHTNPDTTNAILAPTAAPKDIAAGHALADDLWRVFEAHRVLTTGTVHGGSDTANGLDAQLPLAALHSAFISATKSTSTSDVPSGEGQGVTVLVRRGFV